MSVVTPIDAARQLLTRCIRFRNEGRNEAVLRQEFTSWLRQVFPNPLDNAWVNHYTEGSEAGTHIARAGGGVSQRFIDNLIRSTAIEYESDLRQHSRWEQGYQQVKEYVAGVVRAGTPIAQVRGILSDTVDWYVFDAQLAEHVDANHCGPEDVILSEVEALKVTETDELTARRFIDFLRKHLAREQSRPLTASFIATDLGLESPAYNRHIDALSVLVEKGRRDDSAVSLATELWSRFVDYLEQQEGAFRVSAYVDELYIAVVARLLCFNILQRRAQLSDDAELAEILNGQVFLDRFHLHNMVEQDYFGWMVKAEYLTDILPVAREIQHDLYAYDFTVIVDEDLFGRLMTQLARRTARKLLGQEWTPSWLSRLLAQKCLELLPAHELPRLLDICCGSGSILAEVLKALKAKYPDISFANLTAAITGFDIDPLAILLAKTTWVATLTEEILASSNLVTVPVYHADSLFAVTPLSKRLPILGEDQDVVIDLDSQVIGLPSELISPRYRDLFDQVIDWAYDEAREAQLRGEGILVTQERVTSLVDALLAQQEEPPSDELRARFIKAIYHLACRMVELALANRNGIWAFILRNTYRPGLLAGQFNGLVSNPPWLAMSQFADNPYKEYLSTRSLAYGIKPSGAAFLHLELATTHLLHAIDRYLKPSSGVVCLIPGTVFNGQHHAKFRAASYLEAERPVPFELQEIWAIAPGTFKVRSAAVIGIKQASPHQVSRSEPRGFVVTSEGPQEVPFEVRSLGSRTAWVLGDSQTSYTATGSDDVPPQGADLMPRTAVCVEILSRGGAEWQVRTPDRNDSSYFAVKGAKKLRNATFPGWVAPSFIHRMLQSLNLLPFTLDGNFVHIAIPARRNEKGEWEIYDASAIRTMGFRETARRFQRIDSAMQNENVLDPLHEKINERNKLALQVFGEDQYLIVNGAGGEIACAACLPLAGNADIVIDQTLYWRLVSNEDEAWYRVGLINSEVLTETIRVFNPSGEFGERHLHTLPNRVIPPFDPSDVNHMTIAGLAEELASLARSLIVGDERVSDPEKPIQNRRRHLREKLKLLAPYDQLEVTCSAVLASQDLHN